MTTDSIAGALALHSDTQRTVLPNGLTLLLRRDPSAPVVAVVTHVKVGYFDETDDVVGIAHVLEHMYFKGTPQRGAGAIARETKASGGYLNAHTIYDHTSYYTVLPSASLAAGLDLQFDAFAHSCVDATELARELEVIIQEVGRKRDSPGAVTIEGLYELLHDRHRIRRWRMGEETALRAFSRDMVLAFYRRWYCPSNTILAVVGDIDLEWVHGEVLARYGQLPRVMTAARSPGPVEETAPGFRFREFHGDVAQQQIALGWRAPHGAHVDAPALALAGAVLGSGRASRLYRAVREQQLASSVSAWHYAAGDVGVFAIHADTPADTAWRALQEVWRVVHALRDDGVEAREVMRVQQIAEARWLKGFETMAGQAAYLAGWEADGGISCAVNYYDRLFSLGADDVQQVARRYLDPEHVSVINYRPATAPTMARDGAELRELLGATRADGGRALVTPTQTERPRRTHGDTVSLRRTPTDGGTLSHGVHVQRLASGVTLLVLPRAGAPLATLSVQQRGGCIVEPASLSGLARLTAYTMLKGTTRRTSAEIAEAVEDLGASIVVSAGMESLGWSLSVPSRHVRAAAAILADVTQQPTFPDDAVEVERALATAEVARFKDDMFRWPMQLACAAALGDHPYGRAVLGSIDTLAGIDAAAMRAFHAAHVLHATTVIAVTGDVDVASTCAMLDAEFQTLGFRDVPAPAPVRWPSHGARREEHRDKMQTAMALVYPGPGRLDDDRYAGRVLSAVASGLGGRFFEELRDRQSLAYTVSAYPVERRSAGVFAAYIATAPQREAAARDGLLREFAKLRTSPPRDAELERAKRYLIGTQAISEQSASSVLADAVSAWLFGTGLAERGEFHARISAVSEDDIVALAERYFDESRVVEGIVRGN